VEYVLDLAYLVELNIVIPNWGLDDESHSVNQDKAVNMPATCRVQKDSVALDYSERFFRNKCDNL
jgi:hypothetical protein